MDTVQEEERQSVVRRGALKIVCGTVAGIALGIGVSYLGALCGDESVARDVAVTTSLFMPCVGPYVGGRVAMRDLDRFDDRCA